MSDSTAKDDVPPSQNGDSEVDTTEKPVKDPLALADAVKDAALEVPANLNESDDKLDEFSRLELEMAELDKTDDGAVRENVASCSLVGDLKEKSADHIINEDKPNKDSMQQSIIDNDNNIAQQNGQTVEITDAVDASGKMNVDAKLLDHEDLIAVLKGDTVENASSIEKDQPKSLELPKEPSKIPDLSVRDSTDTASDLMIEGVTIEGEGEYQIMEVVDDFEDENEDVMPSTSKAVSAAPQGTKSVAGQKLTPEEVRAMAMEQIAGLNARVPRRRKQDIKSLQEQTSELVSTLGADWSDDEDEAHVDGERPTSSKNVAAVKQTKVLKKQIPTKLQSLAQEAATTAGTAKTTVAASQGAGKKRRNSANAKVTSVVVLKTTEGETDNVDPQAIPGSTGFKRTRTIKPRIIWDPDAPETSFSYAKLVRNNAKDRQETSPANVIPKARSVTPKMIMSGEKRATKRAATPSQSVASKNNVNESTSKIENLEMPSTSKQARRFQTTSPDIGNNVGTTPNAKKKKISEIDRLMGDEGAANMLNSLESGRSKPGEDSDNKPHKPLMRNRSGAAEKVIKKDATAASVAPAATPKLKRGIKLRPSTSWDYVYQKKQQLSEDSMIIRRRSNSSYSSNASQHRLSLDGPSGLTLKSNAKSSEVSSDDATDNSTSAPPRKSNAKATSKNANNATNAVDKEPVPASPANKAANSTGHKAFEFAKPKDAKSNQKPLSRRSKGNANANTSNTLTTDIKKAMPKRGPGRPPAVERLANAEQTTAQSTALSNSATATTATSTGDEVIVRKLGKIAHILFNMKAAQISCTFTPQLMNKFVNALNNLAEDVNCHVVVVTTNSAHFCQGVDITNLATGSADQRKSAAILLATATKNFLRTLATFPKPLVAGIQGSIIGLGVIQLPLFDVVIASDKTSFETPYAKIGQTPEGYCIWQSLPNIRETAKTKLLWMAEKMYSTEASTTGLIDKLTTAERVNEDAMNIAKKLSAMSTETYRYMKNFIVQKRSEAINSSLDSEFDEITTQWTSVECFNKFKKSLEVGHF